MVLQNLLISCIMLIKYCLMVDIANFANEIGSLMSTSTCKSGIDYP